MASRDIRLALATLASICGMSAEAGAQAQKRYFARQNLIPTPPVYNGTWSYASLKSYGVCDATTKKRTVSYNLACSGGQCDPAKAPQSEFVTACVVQTCGVLRNYERFTPGTVVATNTYPLGTPNMTEVARAWCADSSVPFIGCELEMTASNYVVRGVSKYDYYDSGAGPKLWAGLCSPG